MEKPFCKICFDEAETSSNPLISPCKCKGTIKHIHKHCLERWIGTSRRYTCSDCRTPYKLLFKNNKKYVKNCYNTLKLFLFMYLPLNFVSYILHTNSYEFSHLSIYDRIIYSFVTTYSHTLILFSYILCTIILFTSIFMIIIGIIDTLTGNASLNTSSLLDSNDLSWISDYFKKDYPLSTPLTIDDRVSIYIGFFLITSLILYIIYKTIKDDDDYIRIRTN